MVLHPKWKTKILVPIIIICNWNYSKGNIYLVDLWSITSISIIKYCECLYYFIPILLLYSYVSIITWHLNIYTWKIRSLIFTSLQGFGKDSLSTMGEGLSLSIKSHNKNFTLTRKSLILLSIRVNYLLRMELYMSSPNWKMSKIKRRASASRCSYVWLCTMNVSYR